MNMANIDRPSFNAELSSASDFHVLKRRTSSVTLCALY